MARDAKFLSATSRRGLTRHLQNSAFNAELPSGRLFLISDAIVLLLLVSGLVAVNSPASPPLLTH